jgi:hypothetical protein
MALHPSFPSSPFEELHPDHRWFPADETLRDSAYEKLLPPLVAKVRTEVHAWRADHYAGASPITKTLLNHWFEGEPVHLEDHVILRNLYEPAVGKLLFDSFKAAINALTIQESGTTYDFIYVDEDSFKKHHPKTLADLTTTFTEYK